MSPSCGRGPTARLNRTLYRTCVRMEATRRWGADAEAAHLKREGTSTTVHTARQISTVSIPEVTA